MGERWWASGHWRVKDGKTEEFIQQWKEWLTQSSASVSGFHHARLLRALSNPNLFTSMSEWPTLPHAMRGSPALGSKRVSRRRRRSVMSSSAVTTTKSSW
jgi:heme-degrading monooxygenase HmoA